MSDQDRTSLIQALLDAMAQHPQFKKIGGRVTYKVTLGALITLLVAAWMVASAATRAEARFDKIEAGILQAQADHEKVLLMAGQMDGIYKWAGLPPIKMPPRSRAD